MILLTSRTVVCLALAIASAPVLAEQAPDFQSTGLRASVGRAPGPTNPAITLRPEMRGDIYMARKMYREAIDMYRKEPSSAAIDNKIGIAFHQMLQFNLAQKSYQKAVKEDRCYSQAINNLGTIYYAERQYKKAITYYKRALKCSVPQASIYANLGAAYFARRDYKVSTENYQKALALDPDVLERRDTFGTMMQERTVSDLALFHLYMAKNYAKMGKNDRALLYLRKALEEGLKDRKKLPDVPEFSTLKDDPGFRELLALNPKPL